MTRRMIFALVATAALAACGGASDGGAAGSGTGQAETAAETTTSTSDAIGSEQTPATSATQDPTTSEVEATTVLAPVAEHDVVIDGDNEFVAQVEAALALLQGRAPEWYGEALESIERIQYVDAGSGMDVFTNTFLVGQETAYAPGFGPEDQIEWLASTIVHDACHGEEYREGREHTGRDAELECLMEQAASLELHEEGTYFLDYVNGLIEGVDDPANAYWTDPDRHW